MKYIYIFSFSLIAFGMSACSNNSKTEEQESKERDSIDAVQKTMDEHYVDSIMAADMAKDTAANAAGAEAK